MAVRTWVGRFAIVQGQPQEDGPHLRSFPRQRPDEDEDELYVLVEPASGSTEHIGQLTDAIGRLYRQDGLSITGAVLRSLRAAHQQLRDWNRRTLREQQLTAGVGCLAVRGRTAFLAQVAPSIAYHVGDGRFQRVDPENGAGQALGESEQAEPTFRRYELSPGDLVLVASPQITELVDQDMLRSILMRGGEQALVELYRLSRDKQGFAMVLLACVVEPEEELVPITPPDDKDAETPIQSPSEEPEPPPEEQELVGTTPPGGRGRLTFAFDTAGAAPPAGLAQPKLRLKGAEAEVRYPRTSGLRPSLPHVPPLALLGVVALIVVASLAWFIVPSALKESRDDRFSALVADARGAIRDVEATADSAEQRDLLDSAESNLAEAAALRPDDTTVQSLQLEVEALQSELDAVIELLEPVLITDVGAQLTGGASLSELELGAGGAYALDHEQGRVVAISLQGPEPEPVILLEAGQLAGTEVIGRPVQLAWSDGLNSLLVLDDSRRLIAVAPGEPPRLLALRDAAAWGSAEDIAVDANDLYVLDRAGGQVWRYPATENGFDSERQPVLASGADLSRAVELGLGDGVYLVGEDASVRRFQGGQEQPFPQAGIDRAMLAPTAPIVLPDAGRLLLTDQGNDRIVVFTLDGQFTQQLVSPTFVDLRAATFDTHTGDLYLSVGDALYRTPLLAPP